MNSLQDRTRFLGAALALCVGCSNGAEQRPPTTGGGGDNGEVDETPPPAQPLPPTPPTATNTPGGATPVDPGGQTPGFNPTTPLANPRMFDGVGRAARRLNVPQFRLSLIAAVGVSWTQPRRYNSVESPTGVIDDPASDMLEVLARTLGEPDYDQFTAEAIDPNTTFSKLVGDAARKSCRDGITADIARPAAQRFLLRYVTERDTAAANETAVRRNLQYLLLRFWSRTVTPTDAMLTPLVRLFTTASTAPVQGNPAMGGFAAGTPADGWRAVCIALVTDNQFLTY